MNFGGDIFHHTFFVYYSKKLKKVQEPDLYLIKLYIILISKKNCRMNNKNFMKRGVLFLYEVSIVVLIDFIVMLITQASV